jgi:hypothetical protein
VWTVNKKQGKKLTLSTETFRDLHPLDLQEAAGAISHLCTINHSVTCFCQDPG